MRVIIRAISKCTDETWAHMLEVRNKGCERYCLTSAADKKRRSVHSALPAPIHSPQRSRIFSRRNATITLSN